IAPAVRDALPAAGYRVLSTFGPRPAAAADAAPRVLNTHIDPIQWRAGPRLGGTAGAGGHNTPPPRRPRAARRPPPAAPTAPPPHHRVSSAAGGPRLDAPLARPGAPPGVTFPPLDRPLEGEAR